MKACMNITYIDYPVFRAVCVSPTHVKPLIVSQRLQHPHVVPTLERLGLAFAHAPRHVAGFQDQCVSLKKVN